MAVGHQESFCSIQKLVRKQFGRIAPYDEAPHLLKVQIDSYQKFLQLDVLPQFRKKEGLQSVLQSMFPIRSVSGQAVLEFISYRFEMPVFTASECMIRGSTYALTLKVLLRLVVFEQNEQGKFVSVKYAKEQEVHMGDIPMMTHRGSFVVNGTERAVVSQLHRSPGVFFDHDKGRVHSSGKMLYSCRIIPYRGSWLDFEFDARDVIHMRIDRRRKIPSTILLRACGLSTDQILQHFFDFQSCSFIEQGYVSIEIKDLDALSPWVGASFDFDLLDQDGQILIPANQLIRKKNIQDWKKKKLTHIVVPDSYLIDKILAKDIIDLETGEWIAVANDLLTQSSIARMRQMGVAQIHILLTDLSNNREAYISNTLRVDPSSSQEEALAEIYKVIRPGEPPMQEAAEDLFKQLFFMESRYDLSLVGRMKLNSRLGRNTYEGSSVLTLEDLLGVISELIRVRDGQVSLDDIDNLGNRRVRSVGEMVENQFRLGLLRLERSVRERLASAVSEPMVPQDLVNQKIISSVVREFFCLSPLSQFLDQNNVLSDITNKRRISALGPGGLSRDRASFEARDVHPTHYGRICPIETPEGQNIGLINTTALYATIDIYGFIESPYYRVHQGKITKEIVHMSALEEAKYYIGQAPKWEDRYLLENNIYPCRHRDEIVMLSHDKIDFVDVAPKQVVSVAAALIPFLEHDDANRALMGSNMQRQAVPCLYADKPLVGTGIESQVAQDSGAVICSEVAGIVHFVDSSRIVIHSNDEDASQQVYIYHLSKYGRSNQNTCMHHRPLVKMGDYVERGDVIADVSAVQHGELALGQNVLIAFMSWNGYNFEDSILVSERVAQDNVFTSIHVEELLCIARDTKLGAEEITADIPNVSESALSKLDASGIVYIGAHVKSGDILVGKVTPRGEVQLTPEEKLLRAIFGEKASDVKDSSLRVPAGVSGTVIDIQILAKEGLPKDERMLAFEKEAIERAQSDIKDELRLQESKIFSKVRKLIVGQATKDHAVLQEHELLKMPRDHWFEIQLVDQDVQSSLNDLHKNLIEHREEAQQRFKSKSKRITQGDDLASDVLKIVKIYLAVKRNLKAGDKMAGRHGNKGVVSRIVPTEDMPYMENGTPIDIILNPLGVPSRMNIGQILEAHLGWAARGLGHQIQHQLDAYRQENKKNSKEHQASHLNRLREFIASIYDDVLDLDQPEKQETSDVDFQKNQNFESNQPVDLSRVQRLTGRIVRSMSDQQLLSLGHYLASGVPVATPVFDGATEAQIKRMLQLAGLPESGQTRLYDGCTGEAFERPVTVGYMYMLKLNHLVDDKMHARSTGSYSLVTQQPLGGKAQFGGQRFGEMEVWALEAYGASYTLQEMLTVKSDDLGGRSRIYKNIVDGHYRMVSSIPESFNVLIKEIRALGLSIDLIDTVTHTHLV